MKSPLTDLYRTPSSGIDPAVHGTLIDHEGRISTLEAEKGRAAFELRDLLGFLPGAIALLLAFLGKITWLQFIGVTGHGP